MTECHLAQITALLATFGFSRVLVSSLLSTSVLVPCTLHILAHPKGAATKPNFDTAPNESAFSERDLYIRALNHFSSFRLCFLNSPFLGIVSSFSSRMNLGS